MKIKKYKKNGWNYTITYNPLRSRKKLLKKGYYNKKWW